MSTSPLRTQTVTNGLHVSPVSAERSVDPQLGGPMRLGQVRYRFLLLLSDFIILAAAPLSRAQMPPAGNTTSTPAPGGHDYFNSPVETVNPANGSVSVRIPVRVPPGRQVTVPFSFAYDSNGAFYIGPATTGGAPTYSTIPSSVNSLGGWSYSFPVLSFQSGSWQIPNSLGGTSTCYGSYNYVFQDPGANRHNLGLSVSAILAMPGGSDYCNQGLHDEGEFPTGAEGPISATGPGGNPDSITVAGLSSAYKVYWTTVSASFTDNMLNMCQGAGCAACPTSMSASARAVSSVILPNGQQFTFTYEPTYGMISKIIYPSGGYVRYVWGLNSQAEAITTTYSSSHWYCRYDYPAVTDRYVSYDGSSEALHQHFTYTTNWPNNTSLTWNTKSTTVTTTDSARNTSFNTAYNYLPINAPHVPNGSNITAQLPVESTIQYNDTSGALLKTVTKGWINVRMLASQQTTFPNNGPSSLTVYCYNVTELETEHHDYDFGTAASSLPSCAAGVPSGTLSGSLLRASVTNYATFGTNHIVDKPASVTVYSDSAKTVKVAETDFTYDNPVGTTTSGIVQHVAGCNCGNLTQESRWVNSGGTTLNTTFTNDDTGQRLSMTDPRANQTTYSYADSYSSGTPPGPTNAYLTQVTHPQTNGVNHIEHFAYAYASGEVTSSTDQNNLVTAYKYVDNLARLTEIDYPTPDGGVTTNTYTDTPNAVSIETKHKIDGTRWTDAFVLYNGLGQPIAQSTANGEATPWDRTDTCYDGTGRAHFISYPYQGSSATSVPNCATGVGDTFTYDALGRVTQVMHSDANTVLTTYTGRATQVQDEGNSTRRVTRVSQVDGLGRLASVCEVTSATQLGSSGTPAGCGQDIASTGFLTTYSYNPLGDLLSVTQNGLNQRLFNYDFLSRLTNATNPESGSITYTYDSDANCSAPNSFAGLLVSKLDARGIRTCMQYDALNRLIQKNYSDGTPTASFNFDQTSAYGVTLANTTGRLSSESTASPNPTGAVFSYDQLGRVKINSQCTPQNCGANTVFPVTYSYDLLGDMLTSTNGVDVTLTYAVDLAPRLTTLTSSLSDSNHPGTLFSAAHFNAAGSILSVTLAGSVAETRAYDARLRLASITDGSNYTLTIPSSGGYAPNSDILAGNDSVNGNWTYTYDDFNRLMGSNKNSGAEVYSYDYDRLGNRWHQNGPHTMMLSFSGSNNRMDGYSYDAAGNLLNDGTHSYAYDAENRMTTVDNGSAASYVYDAGGQRVRKTTSSGSVDYLYDLAGHEITELSSSGSWNRGEVYAGGRHLATYNNGTTYLIHTDHLGTERVRADSSGTSCETITSLPFGDWQTTSGSCGDPSPMHFTGKERDNESNLDNFGARYISSSMGRFVSADPITVTPGRVVDPQQLNLYSYVRNNPLRLVDPTGMIIDDSQLSDKDKKKWQKIQDLANKKDKDGNYVNKKLHDVFDRLQSDKRTFVLENSKLGAGTAGKFTITEMSGNDFTKATLQLDFKQISSISSTTPADQVPGFNKFEGIVGNKTLESAEVFGHEGAHGVFALDNTAEAVGLQGLLNQQDAALKSGNI